MSQATKPGVFHLGEHPCLQHRIDVAQEYAIRLPVSVGNARPEAFKHVELGIQSPGFIEGKAVFSPPPEGLSRNFLQPPGVNGEIPEQLQVLLREVLPNHGNQSNRSKKAGRQGEIGSRASQNLLGFSKRGLNGIESHRAHDQD